jgi:hypothetical protein
MTSIHQSAMDTMLKGSGAAGQEIFKMRNQSLGIYNDYFSGPPKT